MNNPLPFHQNAKPAAILAMEAFEQGGADKFWEVHDLLFENQRALARADLERYAEQAGLNMAQVRAALDNEEHMDVIEHFQDNLNQNFTNGQAVDNFIRVCKEA